MQRKLIILLWQWIVSLLLYVMCIYSSFALHVVLTVTPTKGPSPLSVSLSAKQTVVSPGEAIYGYKWQVNGPENFVLGSVPGHVITLNKVGQYTVTLTIEETTRGGVGFGPGERRSATVSKVITVHYPNITPTPTTPTPTTPTPTTPTPTTPTPTSSVTFTYSPINPTVNDNVTLRVQNPSSGGAYIWDVSPPLQGQANLSGPEVVVRFSSPIYYDVTLKVNNVPQPSKSIYVKSPVNNGDTDNPLIDKISTPVDEGSNPSTTTPNQDIPVSEPSPQIQVIQDGVDRPVKGSVYINFGTTTVGSSVEVRKFTIKNVGNIPLKLNGPEFRKPLKNFIIDLIVGEEEIEKVENQEFLINPGENLNFSILLNVGKEGNFSNEFKFVSDDSIEFIEFKLDGVVEPVLVAPTANFTYAPSEWVPATLFLDASSSKAADGLKIEKYTWNAEKTTPKTTNEPITYMTFTKGGLHKITLTVKDNKDDIGQTNSFEYYVTVPTLQHDPVPRFTIAKNKQQLLLNASSSFDPDGGKIESYKWSQNVTSTKNSPEKGQLKLSDSKTYSISLQVTDNEGHHEDITTQITLDKDGEPQILPVANFHVEFDEQIKLLSTMEVDISNSFHPYGHEILGYEWFLGTDVSCKTRNENKQDVLDVDDQNTPIHKIKFTKGDIYYLCLSVTDNLLNSSVKGKRVYVVEDYSSSSYNEVGKFRGGLLVKNEFLPNNATLSSNTFMDITAEITIDSSIDPLQQTVNVYVAVEYKPNGATNSQFFMKDEEIDNFAILEDWDDLRPALKEKTFKADDRKLYISLFSDIIRFPGTYKFYIGYNVSNFSPLEANVHNASNPITFTVVP